MRSAFVDLLVFIVLTIGFAAGGCKGIVVSQDCTSTQSCASQGFQCGTFTDSCGAIRNCGTSVRP